MTTEYILRIPSRNSRKKTYGRRMNAKKRERMSVRIRSGKKEAIQNAATMMLRRKRTFTNGRLDFVFVSCMDTVDMMPYAEMV